MSQDISFGIAMGYRMDGWVLFPSRGKRFFSTAQHPDWLWDSPNLLFSGYWGVKLTTPLLRAQIKNGGTMPPFSCTSSWHSAVLIKNRDNSVTLLYIFCFSLPVSCPSQPLFVCCGIHKPECDRKQITSCTAQLYIEGVKGLWQGTHWLHDLAHTWQGRIKPTCN
jgi:hypothetical protein